MSEEGRGEVVNHIFLKHSWFRHPLSKESALNLPSKILAFLNFVKSPLLLVRLHPFYPKIERKFDLPFFVKKQCCPLHLPIFLLQKN